MAEMVIAVNDVFWRFTPSAEPEFMSKGKGAVPLSDVDFNVIGDSWSRV